MPEQDWDHRSRVSDKDDPQEVDAPVEVSVRFDVTMPSVKVLFTPRTEDQQ